jgi:hypothetical protein
MADPYRIFGHPTAHAGDAVLTFEQQFVAIGQGYGAEAQRQQP